MGIAPKGKQNGNFVTRVARAENFKISDFFVICFWVFFSAKKQYFYKLYWINIKTKVFLQVNHKRKVCQPNFYRSQRCFFSSFDFILTTPIHSHKIKIFDMQRYIWFGVYLVDISSYTRSRSSLKNLRTLDISTRRNNLQDWSQISKL